MMCREATVKCIPSIVLMGLLVLGGLTHAKAGEVVRINGTGSSLEMMRLFTEAYGRASKAVTFEMEKPLGSSGAIKALLAGAIDIAVVSRPPDTKTEGGQGRTRYFGKTPLAIVVEPGVPVRAITTKELEDIYSGAVTKWPDGKPVRVILRPKNDIDTKILRGLSPGMDEAVTKAHGRPGMFIAITDPESNAMVARSPGGIGAAGLNSVLASKTPLKVLALNGAAPGRKSLADGAYPLAKEIYFVTAGNTSRPVQEFLDFVYSKKGRTIAEQAGVMVAPDGK